MRNVTRIEAPQSFLNEAKAWTSELRRKRKEGKDKYYYYNRYNQPNKRNVRSDMEDSLLIMYSKMCCYCEDSTQKKQGEIEHLRPKKKFWNKTYDWTNLHWVCHDCNGIKREKYDDANPILDPSEPEPIDYHIELRIDSDMLWLWLLNKNNSPRGYTTIEHAGLNREILKTARMKIYLKTQELIKAIQNNTTETQESKMNKNTLKNLYNGKFGFVTSVREAFAITRMNYNEI